MARPLPPPPDPLPHPVVDNHAHLDHARAGEAAVPVGVLLDRAEAAGVTRVVQIGCELESARWTRRVVEEEARLLGGVALHPTEAAAIHAAGGAAALEAALAEIEDLADHPRIRVVGETGLDHYWVGPQDVAGRQAQEVSFRRHVALAARTGRVLQVHDREAHDDVLRVLAEAGAPATTVLHCFSGDVAMARHCAEQGWFLSFAGTLTFKNAAGLREALRAVPLDQVLVETDSPYLAPAPHRGATCSPALAALTVRCIAEVLGRDLVDVCRVVDRTSTSLYGPW
jgi:TatD DNase family protein